MILIDTDNEYNVVSIEDIDLLETCVKSIHEIIRLHN